MQGLPVAVGPDAWGLEGLNTLVLLLCRLAPLAVWAPWLLYPGVPFSLRAVVVLALVAALGPLAVGLAPALPGQPVGLAVAALVELGVGTLLALATALPVLALRWGGWFADLWRGGLAGDIQRLEASPLARLYMLLGIVAFWAVGGPLQVVGQLGASLDALPLGGGARLESFRDTAVWGATLVLQATESAAATAAPVAVTVVLLEVLGAFVSRFAPHAHPALGSLPWRAVLALGVALVALPFLLDRLSTDFQVALSAARAMVARLGS